jgi:hypothetical protein
MALRVSIENHAWETATPPSTLRKTQLARSFVSGREFIRAA